MSDETSKLQQLLVNSNKTVFTTRDLSNIWNYENYNSLIQRISYLTKTGKLEKIKKGLYNIKGVKVNELELGNKIRTPSYISFETVLHKEGVIYQWDRRITLAAKNTINIEIDDTTFVYRKLKDDVLFNINGIKIDNNISIASKERAILDMLYIDHSFSFDNLRNVDFSQLKNLLNIYNQKSIIELVEKLEKDAKSY